MTLDIYTNWTKATVVYVNSELGLDNNAGTTPDSPKGSWGAALNYLRTNTTNASDRDR